MILNLTDNKLGQNWKSSLSGYDIGIAITKCKPSKTNQTKALSV